MVIVLVALLAINEGTSFTAVILAMAYPVPALAETTEGT
jgi:hypothetical protein